MAKLVPGENDFATIFPVIAREADGWDPSKIHSKSGKKMLWRCVNGHSWKASIIHRSNGRGCPFCSNKKVLKGFNDLKTKFPNIAQEADGWDPTTVSPGSAKLVSWKCNYGHVWQAPIRNRTQRSVGCPFCKK